MSGYSYPVEYMSYPPQQMMYMDPYAYAYAYEQGYYPPSNY
jgi:hypothetical protein